MHNHEPHEKHEHARAPLAWIRVYQRSSFAIQNLHTRGGFGRLHGEPGTMVATGNPGNSHEQIVAGERNLVCRSGSLSVRRLNLDVRPTTIKVLPFTDFDDV